MTSSAQPEPTLGDVISKLDDLSSDVERLTKDVEAKNTQFEKWDGRLWGLTLGLIGTAWTAIFAASAVVITRILSGGN
ncbi:hypothetical protein PGN35_022690 [Nodosilinea sp. PGN35]|uniref:hypothetical protein n=1 Tax=Nodosilinea sp. PGN35 TaxID=3020489 RepID=UPI0023B31FDA|nr:hypothetical protein [Nodosilinea sp. TSF1-S3]MDF0366077.1 hypothetical protein [Nodosilinea sp. TSF1-S3]